MTLLANNGLRGVITYFKRIIEQDLNNYFNESKTKKSNLKKIACILMYSRQDSNLHHQNRNLTFYPIELRKLIDVMSLKAF